MRIYGPTGPTTHPLNQSPLRNTASVAITAMAANTDVIHATYTVPTGKRALVSVDWFMVVTTALAAGQNADLVVQTRAVAAGAISILGWHRITPAAAIGTREAIFLTSLWLAEDNVLELRALLGVGAGVTNVGGGVLGVDYST